MKPKHPVNTDDAAQSGEKKGAVKAPKKTVDVATLEKSTATSSTNPDSDGPVAAGQASG